jgi:mono/diheme cytochrome c family protein
MKRSRRFGWLFLIFISIVVLTVLYLYFKATISTGPVSSSRENNITVIKDHESVARGMVLFKAKCGFCHNAYNTETIVGPGLKSILSNPELPASRRPATPENIRGQLKRPFGKMPSFDYLSEGEVEDIMAFLSTL